MTRPQQIRAVFQELRQALGDRFSASELLEQAAALVDWATNDTDPLDHERLNGWVPFEEWPLDVAMADGGWRIFHHVYRYDRDLYDTHAFE